MNLGEVKAYLRISTADEDDVLNGMIAAATDLCEQFLGQWLVAREAQQTLRVRRHEWQRLSARPVRAILSVTGLDMAGDAVALPVDAYRVDIDGNGDGWVRVDAPGAAARIVVTSNAGMAMSEDALPAAIRQGVVRLAAEQYARRDGAETDPPATVAALWRPYRRMRLA